MNQTCHFGIELMEMGETCFQSKKVPVVFRAPYLEWIDPQPDENEEDITIGSSRREGNTYYDLKMITDGFRLTVAKARIEKSGNFVAVFPLSQD